MTDLAPRSYRTARGDIEAAVVGDGPALLVIHGTPGDWRQGRTIADDFAPAHRVVLVSRPGYGRTRLGVGRTAAAQAAAYAALLDVLGIDRAAVVGISGGGPSAYAFATQQSTRCAALLLCCAVADHLLLPPVAMRRLAAVPGVWRVLAAGARPIMRRKHRDDATVEARIARELTPAEALAARDDPRAAQMFADWVRDSVEVLNGTGLRNDTRQFAAAVARGAQPWPSGLDLPTIVMHGTADTVVPVDQALYYGAAIPGAELRLFEGYGHGLPLTARSAVAQAISDLGRRAAQH